MNNPDFHKERSSLQLPGKEFMIVVVVIFSALSFTLGYFVGKYGDASQTVKTAPIPQKQETAALLQPQNAPASENKDALQAEATAGRPDETLQKGPVVIDEAKKPEALKTVPIVKGKTAAQPATQQLPKEPVKDPSKDPLKKTEAKAGPDSEAGSGSDGPLYTVQMAAFKSASEAKSFSKKHSKKGLKTYITTSTGKKKIKIYKVKTGEFKDRKAAEVLSLKLNKTEKLKSFVTLKSE